MRFSYKRHKWSYRQSLSSDPGYCYLCGFRIPAFIVNPSHPLYGTVDHLKPLSMGGPNVLTNRVPAHRVCNLKKGHGEHSFERAVEFQAKIISLLEMVEKKAVSGKSKGRAIFRISRWWPLPEIPRRSCMYPVHVWEDEGGAWREAGA